MNTILQNFRALTQEELSFVSGGGGSDPLPDQIFSWQTGQDYEGGPLFYNVWYTSQGEFIREEKNSPTNAYLDDLQQRQQLEDSINNSNKNSIDNATRELEESLKSSLNEAGLSYNDNYNYNYNYYQNNYYDYYFDNLPRTFNGQLIDFIGVGTNGGELAYA